MSVDVSGRQLVPGLVPVVAGVLAETGFPPELLVLELTESVLVGDDEGAVPLLQALRDLGVRLAIDDVGTGYSSPAYLSRLPVDALEVDRRFVGDLAAGRTGLAPTILDMPRGLGLSTTAEGVETGEQLRLLRELGCDLAQGFWLSRPVPAEQVDALLLGGGALGGGAQGGGAQGGGAPDAPAALPAPRVVDEPAPARARTPVAAR